MLTILFCSLVVNEVHSLFGFLSEPMALLQSNYLFIRSVHSNKDRRTMPRFQPVFSHLTIPLRANGANGAN